MAEFVYRDGQRGTTALATGRWSSENELIDLEYKPGEFWLGYAPTSKHFPVGYNDDRHITLVAGSRSGKGTTTIINNLCLWPGSSVVIDPKGENATVTARRRGQGSEYCRGMGQIVRLLDPFEAAVGLDDLRSSFNPLDAIDAHSEEAIDEAGRIADALVVVQDKGGSDPFWDESARSLVKGLILHVISDNYFEGKRNLITVRQLIARGDWETVKVLEEAGEPDIPSPFELLFEGMRRNERYDGVIAGVGASFGNMASNSPKTFESILQTANRNTEFIDSPGMRRLLEKSDFKLSDLKTDPAGVSLFLSLPQRYMNTHYRWLRMMITLVITEMEKTRGMPATGHRLLLVLDEFAGLKRMEVLENAAAQIAGFGVKMFFIVQTLGQLKDVYKENWQTFLANSGLHLFAQIDDEFTRKYVSDTLGETEIMRRTGSFNSSTSTSTGTTMNAGAMFAGSKNAGGNFLAAVIPSSTTSETSSTTQGWSESIHKTHLLSPSEVGRAFARIDDKSNIAYPGLSLALVSGRNPVLVHKANYYDDEAFLTLFDPHPDHKPPLTLSENSERLRESERQRNMSIDYKSKKDYEESISIFRRSRLIHILQLIAIIVFALYYLPDIYYSIIREAIPCDKGDAFCLSAHTERLAYSAIITFISVCIIGFILFRKMFIGRKKSIDMAYHMLQSGVNPVDARKQLTNLGRIFKRSTKTQRS